MNVMHEVVLQWPQLLVAIVWGVVKSVLLFGLFMVEVVVAVYAFVWSAWLLEWVLSPAARGRIDDDHP